MYAKADIPEHLREHGHKPHAVVVGSGFGGLAAAVRLQARGYRVTVIDKRDKPGGRAYTYEIDGFKFDGGPTVITAPWLFEELWELHGRKLSDDVDIREVTPFYDIRFDDGSRFAYTGDHADMCRQIAKFNPADVPNYERFLKKSEAIFNTGYEELGDISFGDWKTMAKIVPDMMKLESFRTVYGMVSKYMQHEKLRQVFSFHPLLVGGNPFTTTSIYALICYLERKWGVWYAMGGTGSLVNGLVNLIEENGGEVKQGIEVREIMTDGDQVTGVRFVDGAVLPADVVVSNADSAWTYRYLMPSVKRKRWTNFRLEHSRYSMSLFVWYFGTKKKYEDVNHHTILLGPRYKELLDDIFKSKRLSPDFSLYLHRPTATDPSMAPEGQDCFYVLSPVPHLDSGTNWDTVAEGYRKKISEYLDATVMPGIEENVVASHVLTPQGFHDELNSFKGAAFSFEPILQQSAWFRPHNKSEEVDGLYFVGAGTHPGAGMPGVLTGAKVLDRVVPHGDVAVRRGVEV